MLFPFPIVSLEARDKGKRMLLLRWRLEAVIGQNERRRQLTPSQVAVVAERMATLRHGGHKGNRFTKDRESPEGLSLYKLQINRLRKSASDWELERLP